MTKNLTKWFALDITVASEASEAVEFALNELDALGTEINNLGKDKPQEILCVAGYFNERIENAILLEKLNQSLRIHNFSGDALKKFEWREVEDTDWLAEWKKHWKPTETDKFIIAPNWEKVENTEKIVIYIEPNMAFGTGTHETTKLCLRAIGENFQSEMSFFDVGTGTGILAIAANKLRTRNPKSETRSLKPKIVGCDTDTDSIKIAKENAAYNNISDIEFYIGSISAETAEFDFVCANLTADVILPILELLVKKTRKILVLSGLLEKQQSSIAEKLDELKISDFKIQVDGEWISVVINKSSE